MNECSGLLLACVANVPVRGERGLREGVFRIRAARKMGRSKKVEGGVGEGREFPSLPHPSPSTFLLLPIFRAARMRKTPFVQERSLRTLFCFYLL